MILQCFIKETSNFYFLFFISFLFFLLFVLRCHADPWLVWNSLCGSVSYELMSLLPQPSELLVYGFELPCPAKHYFQKPKLNVGDAAQLIACFLSMPEAPDSIHSGNWAWWLIPTVLILSMQLILSCKVPRQSVWGSLKWGCMSLFVCFKKLQS